MKKFSKLLAVVLAIAVIICPMMIFAETSTSSGTYKIALVDANTVQLTINSTDGFVAYHAIVGFNKDDAFQSSYNADGYVDGLKVNSYTLKTAQANDHNTPTIRAHASGTSLNVIVMPSDTNNLDLCTKIVIGIRVADGTTASLTKIQAADNGTVDSEDANLLTFPAAGSDGVIDKNANDYDAANAVAAHVHTVVEDAAVAPTCTETGLTAGSHCSVCNEVLVAQTVVPALGHSFTNYVSNNDATCTQDGTKTAYCDHKCGTTKTITDEGSALGHNMTHHDAASSTCLVQGNIEYYSCSRCKKLFANESGATELTAEQIKTALAAHTPSKAVVENDVASTCTTAGHYQEVVYCSVCGVELSRDTYNKELKAHSYGEWTADADGHSRTCSVCNAVESGKHDGNPCSVCGYEAAPAEPVVDSGITFRDYGLQVNKCLNIKFRLTKANVSSYARYEVVATPTKYSMENSTLYNEYTGDTVVLEESGSTSNYYVCYYRDMMMHELGLNIDIRVNCYDANNNLVAYSPVTHIVPRDLLLTEYQKPAASQELKTVIADLLYMCGTIQQTYAEAVPASDLAKTFGTESGPYSYGIDPSDCSDSYGELTVDNTTEWNDATNLNNTSNRLSMEVVTGKAPNIRYYIYGAYKSGAELDLDKLVLTYSYTSNNPALGTSGYISNTISGSEWGRVGTRASYNIADLAYYDSDVVVTATLTYDGVAAWTSTFSVETWAQMHIEANDANKLIASRIAKFGDSIRKYTGFGSAE